MMKKVAAITTIALLSSTFGTSAFASTYKVQKGDTLTHIAKKYNTSVSQLKTLNHLTSDAIYINQSLQIAATTKTAATPTTSKPSTSVTKKPTSSLVTTSYTVVKGDTLSKIASNHGISLSNLMKWNTLDNYIIYPGQKLKVSNGTVVSPKAPAKSTAPVKNTPPANSIVPVKNTTPAKNTPPAKEVPAQGSINVTAYTVVKGDTLSKIAAKVGMTVTELKQLNSLKSDLIYVGQKLNINGHSIPIREDKISEETSSNETVGLLINLAKSWIGSPYLYGGVTLKGFDCSGFIYYVFNAAGENLSRQSTEGYFSRSYYVDSPQAGDLVFFENTYKAGISHMGIYIGNNEFIHASSSKGVMISNLNEAYYKQRFDGFKRFY